jgi:uncharacterized repeat protein (TIGR03803 family)
MKSIYPRAATIPAILLLVTLLVAPPAQAQTHDVQHYIILYAFCQGDCIDGTNPTAGVIQDVAGNFYGTTEWGGDLACNSFGYGCGVVFKVNPKALRP